MTTQTNTQDADQVVLNLEKVFGVTTEEAQKKISEINDGMPKDLSEDDYLPEFAKRFSESSTKEELAFAFAMGIRKAKHDSEQLQKAQLMMALTSGGQLSSLLSKLQSDEE